jgi:hypothetical protein
MMASVSPRATSRSTPRKISCSPIFFANERTAIIGDELPGTRWGLVDGFGDGGASIIATHNFQRTTLNSQLPDITDILPDK